MKSKLLLLYFFVSIIICRDLREFEFVMNVYSDVQDSNVNFTISPNSNYKEIEKIPVSLSLWLKDDFLLGIDNASYYRAYNEDLTRSWLIRDFNKKYRILRLGSLIEKKSSAVYSYEFSTWADTLKISSNKFQDKSREVYIPFFLTKESPMSMDTVRMQVNIFSSISENIDAKYYFDHNNKDKFKVLSKYKRRHNQEPIFSDIIDIPNQAPFEIISGIRITYQNPKDVTLADIVKNNESLSSKISKKERKIPIIILATIVGIMLIFIMILVAKETIKAKHRRTVV